MSQFISVHIRRKRNCSHLAPKWNICRACLNQDLQLQPISSTISIGGSKINLSDMMIFCTTLQVSTNDLFPQHLCCECVQQLCNAYNFKLTCEKSFEKLKQMPLDHFEEGSAETESEQEECSGRFEETIIITDNVETILDEPPVSPMHNTTKRKKEIDKETENRIESSSDNSLTETHLIKKKPNETEKQNTTTNEDQNKERKLKIYLKKHACSECGKKFDSVRRLQSHKSSVHSKRRKSYLCSDCGHVCLSKSGYEAHLASHSKLQAYACSECGKKYRAHSALYVHKLSHTGERKYPCEQCDSKFITWNSLNSHIKTHHTKEKKHVCSVCSKAFKHSASLTYHMRIHTGEKPYSCSECNMTFRSHNERTRHFVTHTGERKYPCTICTKRFGRSNHLKQHMVTHTGERNHMCNICGKAFTQAHVLRTHMRTHPENVIT